MVDHTFGQALGQLILRKRKGLGLTQTQLSEDAYNSTAKTRRISELESGLVANPHPKTIDPIISVLKITDAEIQQCVTSSTKAEFTELDRAYREARNLIDAVALQFEISKPNATLAELDDFLRAKAAEWAALRDRIAAIELDAQVNEAILQRALSALAEGNFEEVDTLLADAESDYQDQRTMIEVRKQAKIRITRGDSRFLAGDPTGALAHYKTASEFFRAFDEREMAGVINELAHRVYENSRQSLRPAFFVTARLMEVLIELDCVTSEPRLLGEASYRLSLAYRNEGLSELDGASAALGKAISYARAAASYTGHVDEVSLTASMSINLANCLMDRAKLGGTAEVDDAKEAIEVLVSTREKLGSFSSARNLLAHTCNSLGAAYRFLRNINPSAASSFILDNAVDAFYESISIAEEFSDAENWGAAKANVGAMLAELASEGDPNDYKTHFLRIRAISEYQAALETFPMAAFPFRAADIHAAMADLLVVHSGVMDQPFSDHYLLRALASLESATVVYSRELYPKRWADARARTGSILALRVSDQGNAVKTETLNAALKKLKEAAEVYSEIGEDELSEVCQRKISSLPRG